MRGDGLKVAKLLSFWCRICYGEEDKNITNHISQKKGEDMKKGLIAIVALLVVAQSYAAPVSAGKVPKKQRLSQLTLSKTTLKRPVTVHIGVRGKKCRRAFTVRMARGRDTKNVRIPARCCVNSMRVKGVGGLTLANARFKKCLRGSASFTILKMAPGKASIRVRKK